MRGRRLGLLLAIAIAFVAGSYIYSSLTTSGNAEPAVPPDTPDVATQIAFWEQRVADQPGITAYTYLAGAQLRAARTTGDLAAYERARAALDQALAINPDFTDARFLMANVHFALHDFEEARQLTEGLAAERRPPDGTLLLLSDIYLALGDYDQAQQAVQLEHERSPSPATASRQAILADLNGDTAQAIQLMQEAAEVARLNGVLPESRAWFEYQVGYLYLKSGDPDDALDWFERSDELLPGYYLAAAGMARAIAAQGDYAAAIPRYEALIAAVPQPAYLAELGDLYTLQGDADAAAAQYETVEFIAQLGNGAYSRQFTLYLLNHDLRLDEALVAAQQDVEIRQDIFAWDTLAWALYKNGRLEEAEDAMQQALALGTRDARLHYHAGLIQAALGNDEEARLHLETVREINPWFDPLQTDAAESALMALQ